MFTSQSIDLVQTDESQSTIFGNKGDGTLSTLEAHQIISHFYFLTNNPQRLPLVIVQHPRCGGQQTFITIPWLSTVLSPHTSTRHV